MFLLSKYKTVLITFFSAILYFFVAFYLERTHFSALFFTWSFLFIGFYLLIKNKQISFTTLLSIAVLFRLIFLFATPNLSQDFYRFIWDGRMILEGYNPYLSLPETFIQNENYPIADAATLYEKMGALNGSHYTNYPPLNQFCFFIAAIFSSKSIFGAIITFKIILILADVGIAFFGKKLLMALNLPVKSIFWYLLNPFIIIEMTGNLHFEPFMLFFFLAGLYQLHQQKWILSAILIGCSIAVKLVPLLFLPLFLTYFIIPLKTSEKNKFTFLGYHFKVSQLVKLSAFYLIILTTVLILFLPFYSPELIANYTNSVGLWFRKFEFNASFYYIFREIGYWFRGYNEIAFIGKIIPILTIIFLLYLSFFKKNDHLKTLIKSMLWGICFYYFVSTTVHPWYVATPLLLSVFTKYRFAVIWSFAVVLSYQAYANEPWQENLYIVAIEYLIIFLFIIYELKVKASKSLIN